LRKLKPLWLDCRLSRARLAGCGKGGFIAQGYVISRVDINNPDAYARNVVLEFESYDAARRYIHSEQYRAARALREGVAEIEMVLVEGV
jgi:uncharacterized protein (DUF1330 family)